VNKAILTYIGLVLICSCNTKDDKIRKDSLNTSGKYWSYDTTQLLQMEVRYLPPELMAKKESKDKSAEYEAIKQDFSNQLLFKVNLKWRGSKDFLKEGIADVSEFEKRLTYFLTESKFDFYLASAGDTINPMFVEVERTFGQTPFISLLMGFDNKKINSDATLIYNAYRWNMPDVKVKFDKTIFN
jgi:hypothetical protein